MEAEAGPSRSEEPEAVQTTEDGLPPNASETLYLHNLNEKVRIPGESDGVSAPESARCVRAPGCKLAHEICQADAAVMKETLASLFKPYHALSPVIAHGNVRMRGQAFVSFRDKETAALAQRDVNEFPLYGKPIVSRECERDVLARSRSKGWLQPDSLR